jgi:hypothetical protein
MAGGMAQMVECLWGKYRALSSNSSTIRRRKKKKKKSVSFLWEHGV